MLISVQKYCASTQMETTSTLQTLVIMALLVRQYKNSAEGAKRFRLKSQDFAEVVKSAYFIDKTMMIQEFIEGPNYTLITAPPLFGKSTNMDMLKRFLEITVNETGGPVVNTIVGRSGSLEELPDQQLSQNYRIFKTNSLNIYKKNPRLVMEHCGQYPVLYLDFKSVRGATYLQALQKLRKVISDAFLQHVYLNESRMLSETDKQHIRIYFDELQATKWKLDGLVFVLKRCLKYLTYYIRQHFNKKVTLLIDDYNALVVNALPKPKTAIARMYDFINRLIRRLVKKNDGVERGLLTSCIAAAGWADEFATKIKYRGFSRDKTFLPYYGITNDEMDSLLKRLKSSPKVRETIDAHYKGYFKDHLLYYQVDITIYNVWSVINYLNSKAVHNYWYKSVTVKNLQTIIHLPRIRKSMFILIKCYSILMKKPKRFSVEEMQYLHKLLNEPLKYAESADYKDSGDVFLHYLTDLGYFRIIWTTKDDDTIEIETANVEVGEELAKLFYTPAFFKEKLKIDDEIINRTAAALSSLKSNDTKTFIEFVNSVKGLFAEKDALEDHLDIYIPLLVFLRETSLFLHVLGDLYFDTGYKNQLFCITVICRDGNAVIVQPKYKSHSSDDVLKQIIESKHAKVIKYKAYKKLVTKDKIYIGLTVSKHKKIKASYLVNSYDISKAKKLEVQ